MPTDEIKGSVIQIAGLLVVLAFYHVLEYVIHRKHHPKMTDKSSFLITPEYLMAFSVGIAEYLIELYFFPWKERLDIVFWFGVACVAVGLAPSGNVGSAAYHGRLSVGAAHYGGRRWRAAVLGADEYGLVKAVDTAAQYYVDASLGLVRA